MSAQKKDPTRPSGKETTGKIDPAALALLTGQVRNLLFFHQEMGISAYPTAPELRQFLARTQRQQPAPISSVGKQDRGQPALPRPTTQQQGRRQSEKPALPHRPSVEQKGTQTSTIQQQLKALNHELTHCRCCIQNTPSSVVNSSAVLGQGSTTPLLLVAGDCFIGAASEERLIWGKEEDAMLWRMMQAIGLDQSLVYVTNAIKCPQPGPVQPGSLMEQPCFSHLEKEIQIIRPKLICAMGDSVTQALLKTKAPLVRLRGSFRPYRYPQGNIVKIMPTYHPRLLLQHPEMKQATWKDLQAVQRMLQTFSHTA
ncbi:Uracil DNA glycosylase superfamily protein [Candidatus Electrothrix laxa]